MTSTTPQVGDGHHECYPQRLIVKFDGGALPMLCPTCRRIVGYMPDGWASARNPPRPEREVKAEALRDWADAWDASLIVDGVLGPEETSLESAHARRRADRIARGDA